METVYGVLAATFIMFSAFLGYILTKERRHSQELREKIDQLQGQSKEGQEGWGKFSELGVMAAGITHEILRPLSSITGSVDQIRSKELEEECERELEQIQESVERMTKIIRNVREYIYRNDILEEEYIPLTEIIDDVLTFYDQRLKKHGIELRLHNLENVFLNGHKRQYDQIFLNLISNSFDAVDDLDEKWIEIAADVNTDVVKIYVSDSGTGIPTEVRSHMLEPFYTTKEGRGTGLGLSLVNSIVQNCGGKFKYVNADHTTFVLELPASSLNNYQS